MADTFPSSPPPSGSRLPLARRAGIGLCAVAVLLAGLGHVIGWRQAGVIAGVVAGVVLLFFLLRAVRRRRSGGLPAALRGLPPGLRGRGGIPGLPRGLGRGGLGAFPRGGLRLPRGVGRARLPGGMRPPLPRGMRPPAGAARSRMPGLAGGRGRPALGAGSGGRFRPRPSGAPAFRSSRAGARAGARAGSPGRRSAASPGSIPGRTWPGRRAGGLLPPRARNGSRAAGSPRPGSGSAPRVAGWRRVVPPRMRPASWTGGTAAPARGWRRLIPPRLRPAAPGTAPSPGHPRWFGRRTGRRSRPAGSRPPRVRVRGARFPWLRRRAAGPRPVRTHRLRPFTGSWVIHHVGRFGRWRVRRQARRLKRRAASPRWLPIRNVMRRMQAFLIAWRSNSKVAQATGAPVTPAVVITPPRRSADPDASRRPRPARRPQGPAPAATATPPYSPATGGARMPNVTSAPIERITQAITDAVSSWDPESVVPDVEGLLENLHKVPDALTDAIKKITGRLDEMPVTPDAGEALREMIPVLATLSERADDAYGVFKRKHEQELDQHYNPRPNEKAWNA